jgi:hypothetical protein
VQRRDVVGLIPESPESSLTNPYGGGPIPIA